jgi:hypothetical protein
MYTGTTWYKESAARGVQVVKTFATGPVQYAIDAIDWGGPGKPADGASFEDLTTAQRALVAETLGYAVFDRQMFYKADAAAADRLILVPVQGQHYQNSAIDWTGLPTAGQGVTFDQLTVQQQQRVLDTIGYRRFDGVIYQDADASADKRYVLTFTEGTDYTNAGITWSTVSIPAAGTAFADLSAQQQFRVLEQTGWSQYTGRVYFRAAATKELVTNFIEGFDYRNADMPWGDAGTTPATRWVVTDGTTKVVVVALDDDGNGVTDGVMVTEPHELFDQGAYGFLLTGTIANLADNHGITIASTEDVIIRGNIQLLGAGSDLVLQSNRWVYWEGEAEIHGNIDIRGGVTLGGQVLANGANSHGWSVYTHAASSLNSLEAGSSITISGAQDVILNGRIVAGGTVGATGVDWLGPDSTISVTAGQRIDVDNALTAAKSVTLRTTLAPGGDDNGLGIRLSSAGGLTAAGFTSGGTGAAVTVDSVGRVEIIGTILSGGDMKQVYQNGALVSETVDWRDEPGTVLLSAQGQMYLGGLADTISGGQVEIGGTVRAMTRIDVRGGTSADGIGVKMPGTARLTTQHADGVITIAAEQNANISGIVLAGGEIVDHYDTLGFYLGSTRNTFGGDSIITITATQQIRLGRDLMAGKKIDVRGGVGQGTPTTADPWADEGIVVGGNVHLSTWREFSTITLSSAGDMSVLAPVWTQQLSADGFAEFADGHLSTDTSFELTIEAGGQTLRGIVTVAASSGTGGIAALRDRLQAALAATVFDVISTPSTTDTATLSATDLVVRLNDTRLMLTGDHAFSIAAGGVGGAERLGFAQIASASAAATGGPVASFRDYAIDAAQRGSVVNLGKADAPGGQITISGSIRAHSGINLYSAVAANGEQKVDFTATGLMETLAGGMVLNPAGDLVLAGDLIEVVAADVGVDHHVVHAAQHDAAAAPTSSSPPPRRCS